jgi:osmoprotectant transport system substrate-binding protein
MAVLLAAGIGCVGTGCGSGDVQNSDVTLTVVSRPSVEEVLLGQIYAKALETVGFKVKRDLGRGLALGELRNGRISGYPDQLSTVLEIMENIELSEAPSDPTEAYEMAREQLEEQELTAFPPASFGRARAIGMLRKTADERGLKVTSDLKGKSEEMTLMGDSYCEHRADCFGGLANRYGITFETYSRVEPPLRYEVLEDGKTDASMLFTTDGRLVGKKSKFVVLEDDKHLLPAANTLWVTSKAVADEAGPDYEKAILDIQKGLTLKVMRQLDAKVELEKVPAAKVADEYLKSIHFTG